MRKSLSTSSKEARHRRRMINIHITLLSWISEIFAKLLFFVGTHLLGHENNIMNFSLQTLTQAVEFIILPGIFLINDSDLKAEMMESTWYNTILDIFNWQYVNSIKKDDNITGQNVPPARRRSIIDVVPSGDVANDDNSVDVHGLPIPYNQNLTDQPDIQLGNKIVNILNKEQHDKRCERNIIHSSQINLCDCEVIDIEDDKDT